MKLEMIYKDPDSGEGCQTVYLAETGELVIQGQEVDNVTRGQLVSVVPGETAVTIAPEVLLSAVLRYTERGAR